MSTLSAVTISKVLSGESHSIIPEAALAAGFGVIVAGFCAAAGVAIEAWRRDARGDVVDLEASSSLVSLRQGSSGGGGEQKPIAKQVENARRRQATQNRADWQTVVSDAIQSELSNPEILPRAGGVVAVSLGLHIYFSFGEYDI